ncbi:ficolin-1-like [Drosophila montana]|uniref:ficolin-1-like n=1 Tax=Drosophila montana TaxID=40370 RepID=UPI00313BE205
MREKEEKFSELQKKIDDQDAIIANLKEVIRQKELQMAQQINLTAASNETILIQNDFLITIKKQLALNEAQITKMESEIKSKDSQIDKKDKEIKLLQSKNSSQLENLIKANTMPSSCLGKLTDIYTIKVPNLEPFLVPCDSKLADNGWTVIQRRVDGSVDFNRDWDQYKVGFGDLHGSFFIGLEKLYHMTVSQPYELYVYLEDFENNTHYAKYSHFLIGSENESYKLNKLGTYSGNAGDSLTYHLNVKFSTPERANDESPKADCASSFKSGWWFKNCYNCNLNGQHVNKFVEGQGRGIEWRNWHTNPLRYVQMMIKPQSN